MSIFKLFSGGSSQQHLSLDLFNTVHLAQAPNALACAISTELKVHFAFASMLLIFKSALDFYKLIFQKV